MKSLHDTLNRVQDEESFLQFAKALRKDREACDRKRRRGHESLGGWENDSIAAFLGPAVAWAEDGDFGVRQDLELASNQWNQFAVFLYCGKIYE